MDGRSLQGEDYQLHSYGKVPFGKTGFISMFTESSQRIQLENTKLNDVEGFPKFWRWGRCFSLAREQPVFFLNPEPTISAAGGLGSDWKRQCHEVGQIARKKKALRFR